MFLPLGRGPDQPREPLPSDAVAPCCHVLAPVSPRTHYPDPNRLVSLPSCHLTFSAGGRRCDSRQSRFRGTLAAAVDVFSTEFSRNRVRSGQLVKRTRYLSMLQPACLASGKARKLACGERLGLRIPQPRPQSRCRLYFGRWAPEEARSTSNQCLVLACK